MTILAWLLVLFVVYLAGARITYIAALPNYGMEDEAFDRALVWPATWGVILCNKLWRWTIQPVLRLIWRAMGWLWERMVIPSFKGLVTALDWVGGKATKFMTS